MGKIVLHLDRMMVERKISLNELAERVGISNVNLSKITDKERRSTCNCLTSTGICPAVCTASV